MPRNLLAALGVATEARGKPTTSSSQLRTVSASQGQRKQFQPLPVPVLCGPRSLQAVGKAKMHMASHELPYLLDMVPCPPRPASCVGRALHWCCTAGGHDLHLSQPLRWCPPLHAAEALCPIHSVPLLPPTSSGHARKQRGLQVSLEGDCMCPGHVAASVGR